MKNYFHYESEKNTLSPEEQWIFCIQFLLAFGIIQSKKEAESFPSPVKEFLLGCLALSFASPIPGASVLMIFPLGAMTWKYKKEISNTIEKTLVRFYY